MFNVFLCYPPQSFAAKLHRMGVALVTFLVKIDCAISNFVYKTRECYSPWDETSVISVELGEVG
ncbi:hypothetical protein EPI10_015166 [Gossypium australe]|uniref:Uncharacterized protein n=1 Tax=Gossypium australe TaxID=47621 RepID=A0A5B6VJV9_9ROSI|nr:hypothetical protein EPI10_015166 [Gossypium australe]